MAIIQKTDHTHDDFKTGEQLENETLFSIGYYLLLAVASRNKKYVWLLVL